MQTVVNIAFGASTATVLLTVPSMIVLSWILGLEMNLWLWVLQWILLIWTIFASIVIFWDGKLNRLEWFVFMMIFVIYIFLMFMWVM
jgi:Ca2+:H+ antiporter